MIAVGAGDSTAGWMRQRSRAVMGMEVSDLISCGMMEDLDRGRAKNAACTVSGEGYRRGGEGFVI